MLVDSPPGNAAETTADPPFTGWNYQNVYRVTVSNSIFGASGPGSVTVPFVHNSPAKQQACPTTGGGSCQVSVTKSEVKDKNVNVTIKNSGSSDVVLTALSLTWPQATNGDLVQVKIGPDVIYGGPGMPPISGGTANLTTAQLVADAKKRTIKKGPGGPGGGEVLTLVFKNKADTNLAHYTGTVAFGPNCLLTILP